MRKPARDYRWRVRGILAVKLLRRIAVTAELNGMIHRNSPFEQPFLLKLLFFLVVYTVAK
jgi:hypothetical protein